jgi:XTP/dITP diphosphohydrolase
MTGMPDILLATHNVGKVREIRQVTAHLGWVWRSLDDFPGVPEAVEETDSFAENARCKALHYAAATGLATLADDSGLEVDCLGGGPGVQSARYGGTPRDDAANNRKLVAALVGVPLEKRTARFRCVMVFARPGAVLAETQGAVEGLIIDEPRGDNGFGYDPHFFLPRRNKTMAELPPDEKNAISHRGQALRAMLSKIADILVTRPLSNGPEGI